MSLRLFSDFTFGFVTKRAYDQFSGDYTYQIEVQWFSKKKTSENIISIIHNSLIECFCVSNGNYYIFQKICLI